LADAASPLRDPAGDRAVDRAAFPSGPGTALRDVARPERATVDADSMVAGASAIADPDETREAKAITSP
jgi:hypothetical protein